MRALVLEDDVRLRSLVVRTLTRTGLACDEASNVEEADELLTLLHTRPVDAVILDVSLGDRDGIEVLKHIRASFPRMPVLMISMHSEDVFAMRALRAGALDDAVEHAAPRVPAAHLHCVRFSWRSSWSNALGIEASCDGGYPYVG